MLSFMSNHQDYNYSNTLTGYSSDGCNSTVNDRRPVRPIVTNMAPSAASVTAPSSSVSDDQSPTLYYQSPQHSAPPQPYYYYGTQNMQSLPTVPQHLQTPQHIQSIPHFSLTPHSQPMAQSLSNTPQHTTQHTSQHLQTPNHSHPLTHPHQILPHQAHPMYYSSPMLPGYPSPVPPPYMQGIAISGSIPEMKRKSKQSTTWTPKEDKLLRELKEIQKLGWREIAAFFEDRTPNACQFRWRRIISGTSSSTMTLGRKKHHSINFLLN